MRLPSTHDRRPVGANLTPMIDVVFLLIIFFLVSSHLAKQENNLPLNLPVASRTDPVDPTPADLVISVDPQGRWLLGGRAIDRDTLAGRLAGRPDTRSRTQPMKLRVRCDRDVPYAAVEPILRTAAEQGIADVHLSVHRADDGGGA